MREIIVGALFGVVIFFSESIAVAALFAEDFQSDAAGTMVLVGGVPTAVGDFDPLTTGVILSEETPFGVQVVNNGVGASADPAATTAGNDHYMRLHRPIDGDTAEYEILFPGSEASLIGKTYVYDLEIYVDSRTNNPFDDNPTPTDPPGGGYDGNTPRFRSVSWQNTNADGEFELAFDLHIQGNGDVTNGRNTSGGFEFEPTGLTHNIDAWNHVRIVTDYAAQTWSLMVNGKTHPLSTNSPFVAATPTNNAPGIFGFRTNRDGTLFYVDDLNIGVVPEPSSLLLGLLAAVACIVMTMQRVTSRAVPRQMEPT